MPRLRLCAAPGRRLAVPMCTSPSSHAAILAARGPAPMRSSRPASNGFSVGARDPNPLVNGRGIRKLRAAGIEVQVGVLNEACRKLNEAFEFAMRYGRPWVVAKIAQSLDGRVATRTGESQWISRRAQRRARSTQHPRCHLGGRRYGARRQSSPNCRLRGGRDPVRVILDTQASLSPKLEVFKITAHSSAPTWVCVGNRAPASRRRAMERAGALTIPCKVRRDGRLDLAHVMQQVYAHEVLSVLVEGGPTVMGNFFDAGLVNRLYAFVAPIIIGGEAAPGSVGARGIAQLASAHRLVHVETQQVGGEWFIPWRREPASLRVCHETLRPHRTVRPQSFDERRCHLIFAQGRHDVHPRHPIAYTPPRLLRR